MRINGFEQIKSFYSWVFNNADKRVKPQHISLYLFLLNQNNRSNWVEWFKCPFDLAMSGACIGNKKTYYSCLNDLQEWGLIKYQKGTNNWRAPLVMLVVLNSTSSGTASVPRSEPQVLPQVLPHDVPLPTHIYKLITDNIEIVKDNLGDWIKNYKDKKPPKPKPEPPVNSFSTEVEETYSQILHFFPNKLHPNNNVRVIRWKTEIERLNRLDKNSFSKIIAVVKWARANKFWKKQFLSMMKLRTLIKNQDVQVFKYMVIQMEDNTDSGELKTYTYGDMTAKNDIDKQAFDKYTSIKLLNGEIAWVKNEDIEKFNLKKHE